MHRLSVFIRGFFYHETFIFHAEGFYRYVDGRCADVGCTGECGGTNVWNQQNR